MKNNVWQTRKKSNTVTLDFKRHSPSKCRTIDDGHDIRVHQATLSDSTHGIRLLQVQRLEQQVTGHTTSPLESLTNHFVQVMETIQQPGRSQDETGGTVTDTVTPRIIQ